MSEAPRIIPAGEVLPAMQPTPAPRSRAKASAKKPAGGRKGAVLRRFALLNTLVDSALSELGRAELAAWLILYRHAKPDGTVTASVGDLARRSGCTPRTMHTALKRLQGRGLLRRLKRGTLAGGPSIWRLLTPEPRATTGKNLPV